MSDETDTSVDTEQLSTETKPTSPFNPDGTFVENWHTLAPEGYEDLKTDQTLPRFKNVWDFSRSHVSQRKLVGADTMVRPNENFSEQDWNEYYDAGGRPKTAGDYNIKKPDDFPEDKWDQAKAEKYQEFFHKIGLSAKQVEAITKFNNEDVLSVLKDQADAKEAEEIALKDGIIKKWGRAYEQKAHRGNIAVHKGADGDEGFEQRLLDKINKDPELLEFASNLGGLFSEHDLAEDPNVPTPADIQTQIDTIMHDPRYSSPLKAVRQPLIDQVMRLREQMNKDTTR